MNAETFCAPVLAATVNGVYQGVILTLLVGVFLRLFTRTNAATRHAVWFVSLALVGVIIPAHYWLRRPAFDADKGSGTASTESAPVSAHEPVLREPQAFLPFPFDENLPGDEGALTTEVPLQPLPFVQPPAQDHPDGETPVIISSSRVPDEQISFNENAAAWLGGLSNPISAASRLPGPIDRGLGLARKHLLQPVSWSIGSRTGFSAAAVLVCLWLAISAFRLALLVLRLMRLRKLTVGAYCPGPELEALFARLCAIGRVNRRVGLMVSARQRSPLVLGFFHPVVLIPADLAGQSDLTEAQHVLAHELAHVRRFDDWANLFQHFIQAVLFFHPSVWWITRKLSLEREIACDDHVLHQSGGPRSYALVLASVAKRISQKAPVLAPGVWNSNSQLQQRISMILNTRRNSSPALAKARLASIISATAVIGLAAVQIGPRVVFAEAPSAVPAAILPAPAGSATPAPSAVVPSGEIVSPPAVVSLVAQADSPGVEPGPKFKTDVRREDAAEAPEVVPPEPPDAPSFDAAPPAAPHVARMSKPGRAPRPGSADADSDGDGSIEGRVRRLEKMVQDLMVQQKVKHAHGDIYFKDGADKESEMAKQEFMIKQQDLDRIKASAERQAARAAEQAQRAAEQAKRATKDLQARLEQDQAGQGEFREGFQRQIEALRKARESLGQEMERLDRQIQKLEKEQQHSNKDRDKDRDKDQQRRSEAPIEKLQAQVTPTPEIAQ
jgi:beta-lactamase regulating signal transducer with metallopeptidase domain